MEFNPLLKSLPFNIILWTGKICTVTIKSLFLFFKSIFRTSTDIYANVQDNLNKPYEHILILGPRNSGKSSLLYRIKLSEFITIASTSSTVEENCEICKYCMMSARDCGHDDLQDYDKFYIKLYEPGYNDSVSVHQEYMQICDKIIYVIDSVGDFHYRTVQEEIITLISEHRYRKSNPKYVIFITKKDIFGGATVQTLKEALKVPKDLENRFIILQGSALTGDGISKVLEFLLVDTNPETNGEKSDLITL
ncbi:ADP-ribosylation factor, putative [Theileria equi strain WA]|uniref:ADP-ribosylation factor, putative n=1 Tax=Theileria equi strain WA TaxID=1537102 RepID=L0AYI1_THEEQ|nr:ADP-ribosylation factor, putative [Theileria equi strain WA]AFZ80625.1 ADP-ribosylation factor, putative [Theileria equi strain WA]|eukprot:XP_004830291.1 ADP-ribosylation factor, putative [Theileria equi strain WA]